LFYKDKKTKVGLIVTMSPNEKFPNSAVNRIKEYLPKAKEALNKLAWIFMTVEKLQEQILKW
jgi:hypothetical protein